MKHIIISALLGAVSLGMSAIPVLRGYSVITNPDGTTVTVKRVGDERFHTLVTIDNLPVARNAQGVLCYRTPDGISDVAAHDLSFRQQAETSFIEANKEMLTPTAIAMKPLMEQAIDAVRRNVSPRGVVIADGQTPCMGENHIPILLVEFSDKKFLTSSDIFEFYDNFYNGATGSVAQYFHNASGGKYQPVFDIYGPVTASKASTYYGAPSGSDVDSHLGELVVDVCNKLNSLVNFKEFDNDGDGTCDVVIIMYAGCGEADITYGAETLSWMDKLIWPCQWALGSSDYGRQITLDKVKINKFAIFNEAQPTGYDQNGYPLGNYTTGNITTERAGIGTMCHEFSHCLGLPDFYDTNYGDNMGMDAWSVMDYGSYNDNGKTPLGYGSYEKAALGWMELTDAVPNTRYTIPFMNDASGDYAHEVAIKITNKNDEDEFYCLEARKKQGWDAYMPANGGMLITHVAYDDYAWWCNVVNTTNDDRYPNAYERVFPIVPDNKRTANSYQGDLWPYGTKKNLTDTSTPAAKVYTPTNGKMGQPVTDITRNADGSVSFWFMRDNSGIEDVVAETSEPITSYFNLQGQPVASPEKGQLLIGRTSSGKAQKIVY